jgi:hypothetical protein
MAKYAATQRHPLLEIVLLAVQTPTTAYHSIEVALTQRGQTVFRLVDHVGVHQIHVELDYPVAQTTIHATSVAITLIVQHIQQEPTHSASHLVAI